MCYPESEFAVMRWDFCLKSTDWDIVLLSKFFSVLEGEELDELCLYCVQKESKRLVTSPSHRGTQCLVQCTQLGEQRARAVVCGKC